MNFVEPIRDRKKIAAIKNLLRGQGRFRDLLLVTVGVNTALRVSDLLTLRIGDFFEADGTMRDRFRVREHKRNKRHEVVINTSIHEALTAYQQAYKDLAQNPKHFVFFNTKTNSGTTPISRQQAWNVIAGVCEDIGLRGAYGTHSLRKTWGYHARRSGVPLELIMHRLNHNSLAYTKRYLGVTDEELSDVVRKLNL